MGRHRKPIDLKTPEGRARFYTSPEWKAIRSIVLTNQPYCIECLKQGIHELANEVDHIIDIDKAPERFMDISNLQSLCKRHHSQKTFHTTNTTFGKKITYTTVNKKWNI